MPFISTSAHQQFIQQSVSFLEKNACAGVDENMRIIQADIEKLKQVAGIYKDTHSRLCELTTQYNMILKRTRINMRKLQLKKNEMEQVK